LRDDSGEFMIVDTVHTVHISLGADSSQMKPLWSENMKMAHASI